jgi:hypothetical protein
MTIGSTQEVEEFLKEFKLLIPTTAQLHLVFRKDGSTQNTMSILGYTKTNVHAELLQLTSADYNKHEGDRNQPSSPQVWIFGKQIQGKEIYIKIKKHRAGTKGVCISFHESKWALTYPHKLVKS